MVREAQLAPAGEVESYPLSPMQQGMLFHRLQGAAPGVDVEQVICELHEPIRAAMFERAWREVIERHSALRTGFVFEDGAEPRQVVHPASAVRLRVHHAEFGNEHEARRGLEEYLIADRREGFATLQPPLLRVALLRGGPRHFWFVTTYHHLLLDARSMTLMFREALDLHDAWMDGRTLELPPARPYRDYIDWLQTLHLPRAEEFWTEHLAGFATPTVLPVARPAAHADDSAMEIDPENAFPGELAFRLPEATTRRLRAVAQKYGVTLNTVVQAAWSVILSRYSGEEDVVFGAVRACRKIPIGGAQSIVGLFINTVPVRVKAGADMTIGAWLRALREQWIALRDYEHTPLMNVQQWSDVAPGRPLFETLLSYQEPAWDAALNALGGPWAGRRFEIRAQPNYPLALEVLGGATLTVKFIHDRARFTDDVVARLSGHYRTVLEAIAADAVSTVGELPLLTAHERQTILGAWTRTAADYPRDVCVHTLVQEHAATAPERIAVTDAIDALTYRELDARADRVAQRLGALGVGPDSLVAVCMERSAAMIVAWLGVLKAGGAFLPLDPGYPNERLAFQIADSRAAVLLTQRKLAERLPAGNATVLCVDESSTDLALNTDAPRTASVAATHLAYVIYTSGSTGQPKGVAIEHRSLMNLVTWHQRTYRVGANDRATHLASPAFDASVWEVWPYLAAGASVHIPDDETRLSPALLWRWMAEKRITISFMPTPLAELAMAELLPERLVLRALLTGGDKLKRPAPPFFPCALVNHYGPTESTVVATSGVVEHDANGATAPTIGKPIANTRAYVLDGQLRPVPAGVPGELFIGGESLARGYLHRPELTAEKFVADPFRSADSPAAPGEHSQADGATNSGGRLYRTGDLVRWTPEGEIEFLGRLDGQVKIRGCRIELGEIEATLQRHPAARESLVVARADDHGQMQLVAYVVPAPAIATASELELLDFLRDKLPSYMIPAAVILLEAWPLTPNGKIDRAALPQPDLHGGDSRPPFAAPSGGVERTVAKIWSDVLRRGELGLGDNFFDLGGHSLLAAQVVARLNAMLPARISVRALFDQPTLGAFAREVERRLNDNSHVQMDVPRMKRRVPRAEMELVPPN